jgi:N-acetylglucosaminyldiphosphoundecaprenol N-acetyl-beta-D-mannosaminyltransferase
MSLESRYLLGTRIDATEYSEATQRILGWARDRSSGYVCAANVHMVMEAHDSPEFQQIVNRARLVTPDGMPLVWALKALGLKAQTRVYGPDLMLHVCEAAAASGIPVGFHGGHPEARARMGERLLARYPGLRVVYSHSPPFRALSEEEERAAEHAIIASAAAIVFVALGCPAQERWMAARSPQIPATLIGVGAAFDFHSGRVAQAPRWLQDHGLEWAFRLGTEPRRLWKRYLKHNPRFAALMAAQIVRGG